MIQINWNQFDELEVALEQFAQELADDLLDAVDEVAVFVAEQAQARAPVNPEDVPTLEFQTGARPAVRTGNVVRAEVEVEDNAADYAALQHELFP